MTRLPGATALDVPSEGVRSQRFGTNCRHPDPATGMLTGEKLPVAAHPTQQARTTQEAASATRSP